MGLALGLGLGLGRRYLGDDALHAAVQHRLELGHDPLGLHLLRARAQGEGQGWSQGRAWAWAWGWGRGWGWGLGEGEGYPSGRTFSKTSRRFISLVVIMKHACEMWRRSGGDVAEMWRRSSGDLAEI